MERQRECKARWACAAGLVVSGFVGCAHDDGLVPAPEAKVVPSATKIAYERSSGVEVLVDGDGWHGNPRDLEKVMTPVRVAIHNKTAHPITVKYVDFSLESPWGERVTALTPFTMNTMGPRRRTVLRTPGPTYFNTFSAPFLAPYPLTPEPWWGPQFYDPVLWQQSAVVWNVPLPTEDMVRSVLPEGVLEPGGRASGFVYFPDVPARAKGIFTLHARFSGADGGMSLASVQIPLVTK
jgi:hypothetical protein